MEVSLYDFYLICKFRKMLNVAFVILNPWGFEEYVYSLFF